MKKTIGFLFYVLAAGLVCAQEHTFSQQCEAMSQAKDWQALDALVSPLVNGNYVYGSDLTDAQKQTNVAIVYKMRAVGAIEGRGRGGGSNPESIAFASAHQFWSGAAGAASMVGLWDKAAEYQAKLVEQDASLLNHARLLKFKKMTGQNVNMEVRGVLSTFDTDPTNAQVSAALFEAFNPAMATHDETIEFCRQLVIRIRHLTTPQAEKLAGELILLKRGLQ